MVERCVTCRFSKGIALDTLAILTSPGRRVEDLTPCVEPGQAVDTIRCRPLGDDIKAVLDEDDVDSDDMGELTGLATLRSAAAEDPSRGSQCTLVPKQHHRLRLTKQLTREGEDRLGLGRRFGCDAGCRGYALRRDDSCWWCLI